MKILRSRLHEAKMEKKRKELNQLEENKAEIAWGSQIRSYIFHPYNLVKDHRSKYETSNVNYVMDGNINEFIRNYLLSNVELNNE